MYIDRGQHLGERGGGHVQASQQILRLDPRLDGGIAERSPSHKVQRLECIFLRIECHEPAISMFGRIPVTAGATLALEDALHLLPMPIIKNREEMTN